MGSEMRNKNWKGKVRSLLAIFVTLLLLPHLSQMGTPAEVLEHDGAYSRYALPDSSTLEVFECQDSLIVVMTVCAPQCSSCARVYNKEWNLIRTITPTISTVFPLATMDKKSGQITWSDNDTWEY